MLYHKVHSGCIHEMVLHNSNPLIAQTPQLNVGQIMIFGWQTVSRWGNALKSMECHWRLRGPWRPMALKMNVSGHATIKRAT